SDRDSDQEPGFRTLNPGHAKYIRFAQTIIVKRREKRESQLWRTSLNDMKQVGQASLPATPFGRQGRLPHQADSLAIFLGDYHRIQALSQPLSQTAIPSMAKPSRPSRFLKSGAVRRWPSGPNMPTVLS